MEPRSDLVQIRQALLEANFLDYQDVLTQAPAAPIPSNKHLRWEKRFLRNPTGFLRRQSRPPWVKVLQTAACILLALCLSFATLLATNAQAREWVERWVLRETSTHNSYDFHGPMSDEKLALWGPSYLPPGYTMTEFIDMENMVAVFYDTADPNLWIQFSYQRLEEGGGEGLDNEHHTISQVFVHGMVGHLYTATNDSPNMLLWFDEQNGYSFLLAARLPFDDLLRIAESVQKAED